MERQYKNILIATHYYPPHIGGIEIVALNQAVRLAAAGNSVTVVTSRIGSEKEEETIGGVRVVRVRAWNFFEKYGVPFPIFSPRLWGKLSKAAAGADIVHVHDIFYMSSFFGALAGRFHKKPVVLTQHVAFIRHPNWMVAAIQRIVCATSGALVLRLSSSIIFYNDRVKDFLMQKGVPERKCMMLSNGVDTDIFHPVDAEQKALLKKQYKIDPKKKTLLFVGRFVPKKGFDKVLSVRSEGYEIVCVGGDAPAEHFNNVIFLGKLSQKTLAEVYQLADIFILPSDSEGFPLSIQEAMASGLPVITTKDEGYKHYGLNENLISFIEQPTEELLREAINALLSDTTRLQAMAAYGQEYAASHFSWPLVISQLEDIYASVQPASLKKTEASKKKIAIVSDSIYIFNKGGKEKRIYDISTRLAEEGHAVTIYCMQWWKGKKTMIKDGVAFYAISPYYPLYAGERRSIQQALFFAIHCLKLLTKDFDVVEVDHIPHLVLFTMKVVCVLKRKRMIVTWHEVWGKDYWKKYLGTAGTLAYWVEKMSVMLPDTIISVSNHTTALLRSTLGVKKEIMTIPNGLDIAGIIANNPAKAGADIVYAGRLLSHKNIDVLLRAMKILSQKNPGVSLCIIGEGPEKERLMSMALALGIEDNVSFRDFFEDHNELYCFMQASQVFALPSIREGFGIVALEANACGLPVITIDHEGNAARELIIDGKNGVLTSLDENEMAYAIEKGFEIKRDQDDYLVYIKKYNWHTVVGEILKVYDYQHA